MSSGAHGCSAGEQGEKGRAEARSGEPVGTISGSVLGLSWLLSQGFFFF